MSVIAQLIDPEVFSQLRDEDLVKLDDMFEAAVVREILASPEMRGRLEEKIKPEIARFAKEMGPNR